MNVSAFIGFVVGGSVVMLSAYRMRSAQLDFLEAYRSRLGLAEPFEQRNLKRNYVMSQLRFLIETPVWTASRLRLLSTPVTDPAVEDLRRRFQRRKLLMYSSVPFAFVLIVLFGMIHP